MAVDTAQSQTLNKLNGEALLQKLQILPFDKLELEDQMKWRAYSLLYVLIGITMIVFPFVTWFLIESIFNNSDTDRRIFFVESIGVMTFAVYWLIKSNELSERETERHIMANASPPTSDQPRGKVEGQADGCLVQSEAPAS